MVRDTVVTLASAGKAPPASGWARTGNTAVPRNAAAKRSSKTPIMQHNKRNSGAAAREYVSEQERRAPQARAAAPGQ